jgi:glycosyltransferase involved in cell wall biosynthesis
MKIVFLIPSEGNRPTGGNKVIYEYANGLSARGHQVHVLHFASGDSRREAATLRGLIRPFRYLPLALRGNWKPDNWFTLSPSVKVELAPLQASIFMPRADVYVAGWWTTAQHLASMRSLPGRRLYLIQHLETWAGPEKEVLDTWKAPLEKIVIARWLGKVANDMGESCHYIPNGLDFTKFGCDVPMEARKPMHLAMLFNDRVSWKGSSDGLSAVIKLKEMHPDLEAEFFGINERPDNLPSWIIYHREPAQEEIRRIYNRASIFLAPSHSEGWGLPPCEAMMCGAAVVATDIGGHREFCTDEETALLVPAKDAAAIALAAARLIDDHELRLKIAKCGHSNIQKFTWEAACDSFEDVLLRPSENLATSSN